ncbi:MAG: hypothetical protein Q8O92_01010 [Candidatus Latescibacter sp.]|nr:hypothetical protein [Candidatus Latescibacter sp.]
MIIILVRFIAVILVFPALNFLCCSGKTPGPAGQPHKIGYYGVIHQRVSIPADSVIPCESEKKRKEMAEHMDREKLLYSSRTVIDSDPKMLEIPAGLRRFAGKEFIVAKTTPRIEFAVVPAEPRFFDELADRDVTGWWGNYTQSNYYPPTGKFYSAVGDHGKLNAHIYLVEYDTRSRTVRCLPEINRSIGRGEKQFGDGIVHGWIDIYQSRDLSRPHIWFCTYWSRFPEPTEADYATGYDGGRIFSFDMETGDIVDYGAPIPRTSWPYHRVDTRRGMLYAVGYHSEFLAWDINSQRSRWAGMLPDSLTWFTRAILLDETTGMVYTANNHVSDQERHLIRYDPAANRFTKLSCSMPKDPMTGRYEPMRAQTRDRGPDGLFWGVTNSGVLFSFDPAREKIVDHGLIWPTDQRYTCSMERSPGGRYVYYAPQAYRDGSPVIQYDIKTGGKKVIAFLKSYYYEKYGYIPAVSYSLKLDDRGEKLFMVWNGAFTEDVPDLGVGRFGNCSVMVINIPESERKE